MYDKNNINFFIKQYSTQNIYCKHVKFEIFREIFPFIIGYIVII